MSQLNDLSPLLIKMATDADSPEIGNITYSLEGSGSDRFIIDQYGGHVTVAADAILDAETQDIFFLTVLADDGDRIGTTLLQINLDDVNDVNPVFNLGPTEELITIQEFSDVGRIGDRLVLATATDGDVTGINKAVIYSITGGNEAGKFAINEITGEITLADTIDYETDSQEYNITVVAQNTADPPLEGSAIITVLISDFNDNAPVFGSDTYRVTVSEDATVGELVLTLTATDADKPGDPNSVIDYRITSGSQDQFRIEVDTGAILVNDVLDREAMGGDYYILEVVATDRGIVQLVGYCEVLVNITDVNDVAPIFEPVQPISIDEDYPTGKHPPLLHVIANDPDLTADLRYSIDTDNIEAIDENGVELDPADFVFQFGVVETTGGLYMNHSLDREVAASFVLPLWVEDIDYNPQDPGDDPQMDEVSLSITVLDVNDNTPLFLNTPYIFSVNENEEIGAVISAEISASDPDLGDSGIVVYSKQSGSGFDYVEINSETGVLTVEGVFNREEHAVLEVVIRATDLGTPPNDADILVTLNIVDVNDNPPVFNTTIPVPIPINEDLPVGTKVLRVTATDLDIDHGEIMYAITAGNTEQKFEILDNKTGVITTKNLLDRETTEVYILTITASDKNSDEQPLTDVLEVTIDIKDVNDLAPVITSPEFNTGVEVVETVEIGTTILFVAAEDGDKDLTPNSEINFYVGGGNGTGLFGIDEVTGEITTLIPLNTLSGSYELVVVVRDKGVPPLESNRILAVEVLDVNDDDPVILFPKEDEVVYLTEDYVGYVLTIDAVDNDKGDNGRITYEFLIIPETPEDYKNFSLNNETENLQ
ncbi:cadherin-23-like [Amphiura filiformis]|uniref:cadherin-23-like n=1 Tax=Amphiura filiformis TaxID=82378 RepID=UPI003B20D8F9